VTMERTATTWRPRWSPRRALEDPEWMRFVGPAARTHPESTTARRRTAAVLRSRNKNRMLTHSIRYECNSRDNTTRCIIVRRVTIFIA
jgi:hypothetical protein